MTTNFELFKQQLDDAVGIIEKAEALKQYSVSVSLSSDSLLDTQSLLSRCDQVVEQYDRKKPVIRTIHHLACSGGSLISKCISALPNVYLLSEVHPLTDLGKVPDKPKYSPSDIISLSQNANIPGGKELASKLFKKGIFEVYEHLSVLGGILVLRDHTHADFHTNTIPPSKSTVLELLDDTFEILSILTIRNPIDAYSSLVKNGWVHFEPHSFDEYCRRYLMLVEQFKPSQVFKYENFVNEPQLQMEQIANALNIPFDDTFEDVFSMFKVTGDSGRSSDVISHRASLALTEVLQESKCSEHYNKLMSMKVFK